MDMIVGQTRDKAQACPLILAGYAEGEFIESGGSQVDSRRVRQQSAELTAVQHGVQCCQTIFRQGAFEHQHLFGAFVLEMKSPAHG